MGSPHNNNKFLDTDLQKVDSHGYAALQLTESLIHSLIDNSIINLVEAQNVISIAIDATNEIGGDSDTRPATLDRSITLLSKIRHSLGEE